MNRVLPRNSQFGQDCSGAEALEGSLRTAIDDLGIIVGGKLITNLDVVNASLPDLPESP